MQTIYAELPSGKARARFFVSTPQGVVNLFAIRDRKAEGLVIMLEGIEMLRPPWIAGDFVAKEFRFSVHPTHNQDYSVIQHTVVLSDGKKLDSRAEVYGNELCWPVYSERCKIIPEENMGEKGRASDHRIDLGNWDPRFHTLIYNVVVVSTSIEELPDVEHHSALRIKFLKFDIVVYWTFLDCPAAPLGEHFVISSPSARTDRAYIYEKKDLVPIRYKSLELQGDCEYSVEFQVNLGTVSVAIGLVEYFQEQLFALGGWPYRISLAEILRGANRYTKEPPIIPEQYRRIGIVYADRPLNVGVEDIDFLRSLKK